MQDPPPVTDPNSMYVWLPAVEACGIPSPKTVLVPFPRAVIEPVFEGEPAPELDAYMQRLAEAAAGFRYPLFLRTDLASGKHSWRSTCYVPDAAALPIHAVNVAEQNEMAGIFGLDYQAFAIRELLELDSTFTAFGGMPVAAERRYFATDGVVQCSHAYWFEEAVGMGRSGSALPPDWKERLAILNDEASDPEQLAEWASRVTKHLGGSWSVDFARLQDRHHWMLIDMALAGASWHPEHTS